jgi:hypothetical protein
VGFFLSILKFSSSSTSMSSSLVDPYSPRSLTMMV